MDLAIAGEANATLSLSHLMVEGQVELWVPTPSSMRHVEITCGAASPVPRRICPALTLEYPQVSQLVWVGVTCKTATTGFTFVCACGHLHMCVWMSDTVHSPPHRVFSHDNILPLLAVAVDPQVHVVGHYMKMGSLYNLLHGNNAGER